MRFTKVLHPEIVLGLRGDKKAIGLYKFMHEAISYDEVVGAYAINLPANLDKHNITRQNAIMLLKILKADPTTFKHHVITKDFVVEKGKAYHIGKDFAEALLNIDKDVPVDVLPESFIGYFNFADGAVSDDYGPIKGGYVQIGTNTEKVTRLVGVPVGQKFVAMTYLNENGAVSSAGFALTKEKVNELINKVGKTKDMNLGLVKKADGVSEDTRDDCYRLLLNAVVYLFSQNNDVEMTMPWAHYGRSKEDLKTTDDTINECTIPVHVLYKSYTRQQHVDSTWVSAHFRWQRCGIGLTQVRLTAISAHERTYKNTGSEESLGAST